MFQFGGPDADGDGIPDVGEKAIGTSSTLVDTDGDGISDDAEITQGLDPLSGRGFPTGIIASLPLPGDAKEVVVEETTAYVATGSHGLAIVDVSQFNNPILLGQLDLPGDATDIAVDPRLNLAAVATGDGLAIVDVSEPMVPTFVDFIEVPAERIEILDGIVYAVGGSSLTSIDLATGEEFQTLNLAGSTIVDMARERTSLYLTSSTKLYVVSLVAGQMTARASVFVGSAGRVFVGNDIAYVTRNPSSFGGYATIDVSNPDQPFVIGPSISRSDRPNFAFAANGSGLSLLGGTVLRDTSSPIHRVFVVDSSDPTQTDRPIINFDFATSPSDIEIASGIGFIATGTGGLQVVNYLPFDNQGQAPTVTVRSPVADVVPNTNGIQVLEGGSMPIVAEVLDDVQVRSVELLVNGEVVRNDVSFPFELSAIALSDDPADPVTTVQVRATDTGGNIALSNVLTFDLIPDVFAPNIDRFEVDLPDIDPNAPGIQILETRDLFVRFAVSDVGDNLDFVELLKNGEVVQTQTRAGGVFPFITPTLDDGELSRLVDLQLRAVDRAGNVTTSVPVTFEVVPDINPPSIANINLADGDVRPRGPFSVQIVFDEPMNPQTLTQAAFRLTDPQGQLLSPDAFHVFRSDDIIRIDYQLTAAGDYQFTIDASTLTDRIGNPLNLTPLITGFRVQDQFGPLFPGPTFATDDSPRSVTKADFNGDGVMDLATANLISDNVSVLLGNGDGTFANQRTFAVGDSPSSVTTGDFNGDGFIDLATANSDSDSVSVLLGNGDGTFTAQRSFAVGDSPPSVATADFNSDGVTDLVTANSSSDNVSVLLGNGDGTFANQRSFAAGDSPVSVATGDFNGDGFIDLATANSRSDNVSVLLGNGNGTFGGQQTFAVGNTPRSVTTGDFNGDGVTDLVTANIFSFSDNVSVLLGNGDGTFANQQTFVAGDNPRSVTTGDFNGDGVTDLAIATIRSLTSSRGSNSVSVLLGNGDGTFANRQTFAVGDIPVSVTTGDFNGDGFTDLIAANSSSDSVSVLLGNGDGRFNTRLTFAVGDSPRSLTTGDFNADGLIDLVTADFFPDNVSVLLGNGDGTFATRRTHAVGLRPSSVTTGDFNGDGVTDLATANLLSDNVSVLLGNGDGTFANQRTFAVGDSPSSVTTGDFNGDGFTDLIAANSSSDNVSVLLGNGGGTFANQQTFAVGDSPSSVTIGDFNGDGVTDLATANSRSDNVSVLLGNGDGTFANQRTFAVGDSPSSVTTGDFNGEGFTDLVAGNINTHNVSVLLGDGGGTFAAQQTFPVGGGASSVTTGDVNADGLTDLVAAGSDVSVLLGNGDGTFANQQTFAVGVGASSVTIVDLNNDGLSDLATANSRDDDVSVLLNQSAASGGGQSLRITGILTTEDTLLSPTATQQEAADLLMAASQWWTTLGVDTTELANVNLRVTDLPFGELGLTVGKTIWLDSDGAGWGWFIDPTPDIDEEFLNGKAIPGTAAEARIDLLTVLIHEIGHVLGFGHVESDATTAHVMLEHLWPSERRVVPVLEGALDLLFSDLDFQDELTMT